ncbi:MAG: PhoH family protein [Candidatus Manganitrophaceae bacterium]
MKKPIVGKVSLQEGTDAALIFGTYDRHIKMIERAFSVRIMARGGEITIEGEAEQVQLAERVLSDLVTLTREGFRLTTEDVNYAIHSSREAPSLREVYQDAAIQVVGKKKQIVPKSPAQKEYVEAIQKNDIVIGIGPAGTGKTYLAMAMAVTAFLKKEVSRIILARPAVEAGEKLGFLPGDIAEKVNPYLRPLYDALFDMIEVDRANRLLERGDIEIAPIAFMRGRTLNDSFIILDEAQNATSEQMKMFLTRLGFGSKAVITGDITQVDLPVERISGLIEVQSILEGVSGIKFVYFTERDVIRHRLVQEIVKAYDRYGGKARTTEKK